MENIWRFFDNINCVSGIVVANSKEIAINYAIHYLKTHFSDIVNVDVCVWKIEDDDDYRKSFPYAVAISY